MAKGGFRGMPGGMNQAAMIKQAQKMQQEMLRMQEEMENKTYSATVGGGMITAAVNGKHEVVSLQINPEAVDPDDVEMLQDMVNKPDILALVSRKASAKLGRPLRVTVIDDADLDKKNEQMEQLLDFGRAHSDIITIKNS